MKRIVILGAKPGAVIPRGDAIYCANAAFVSRPSEVSHFPHRVAVVSSMVLGKGLRDQIADHDVYRMKLNAVRDFDSSEIVLFADPGRGNWMEAIATHLQANVRRRPVRKISVQERKTLVAAAAGVYPLLDRRFLSQPIGMQLRDSLEIVACKWNGIVGDGRRDVRAKYRPSTGLLALLLAMRDHGADAEYILAGIGISDRHLYAVSGEEVAMSKVRKARALPMHSIADQILIERLRTRWRILSSEPELFSFVDPLNE